MDDKDKFVYVARDLDGRMFGACADAPEFRSEVIEFVQQTIRDGGNLERMTLAEFQATAANFGRRPYRLHPKLTAESRAGTPGPSSSTTEE